MEKRSFPSKSYSPYKGQNNYNSRPKGGGYNITQIVESDFSKRKNLKNGRQRCHLPQPDKVFTSGHWEMKHMIANKTELNLKKNELSDYNMKDWHNHTRKNNHAGEVIGVVRKNIAPELLTQAWCKFYEIVSSYGLVPDKAVESGVLNSVHLCEAPGAFITSLNHFLKLRHPNLEWDWRASTLNPYYEGNQLSFMINDDRFILHTLDSWDFGFDQTGDMFKLENMDRLISVANQLSPVLLVTADGSIDCQSDPGEQEAIVSPLHYCETLVALSILQEGGSFLLKVFTMFECHTISLLYLLCCLFESVDLFKPATSKEGNSEVYVVCLNFKGPASVEPYIDVFRTNFIGSTDKVMFSQEQLSMEFLCNICECSNFFKSLQMSVLDRNINTFGLTSLDEKNKLFKIKKTVAYSYIQRYCLEPLSLPDHYIVGNDIIKQTLTLNLDARNEEWTYSDRKTQELKQTLLTLNSQMKSIDCEWPGPSDVVWFDSENLLKNKDLEVITISGKPISRVYSSKFCLGSFLNSWNRLSEIKDVDINSVNPSADICVKLSEIMPEYDVNSMRMCDMRLEEYQGNVFVFEKKVVSRVFEVLKTLEDGGHVVLVGVPLLTRFSVGLVYLTALLFEKICIVNPTDVGYAVVFCTKRSNGQIPVMSILEDLLNKVSSNSSQTIHCFIRVTQLVENEDWHRCIVTANQIHIRNITCQATEDLLSNISQDD